MKKITFFLIFFSGFLGFSQTTLEDFEGTPDFAGFSGLEAGTSVAVDPVDPTNMAGRLEVTAGAGDPWQGANLIMQSNFIDASDPVTKTVKVDVYATEAFSMFAKLDGGQNSAVPSAADEVHNGMGWQTLTFTFNESLDTTAPSNGEYEVLALFPNWNGAGWHNPALARIIYVDNIEAMAGAAIIPPDPCTNGIMDGDETGVDCGGSCPNACPGAGTLEVVEDFEGDAPGLDLADGFASASVVANPDASMGSGNESANALELITNAAGQPWQGAKLIMQNNKIDMTTSNKTMEVDVYSDAPAEFLAKLVDGDVGGGDPAQESKSAAAHTGSGWETLVFDFNIGADTTQPGYNPPNDQFSGIVFFPLFNIGTNGWNDAADTTTYIDNVKGIAGDAIVVDTCGNGIMDGDETGVDCGGSCEPCSIPPSVAAPTPPARNPNEVISIYSDAYNDIGVDTYDTDWCPGTTTEVLIEGNPTQLLTGASCDGIDWQSSRTVDASEMTHFHIDFYTEETDLVGKVFNLKFSQWGGTGGEVSALQFNINTATSPGIVTGSWVSVDIDLTEMPLNPLVGGSLDRDDIVQFVFSTNLDKVWWDNLYLYRATTLSNNDLESSVFSVYPNPTNSEWNIKGVNSNIEKVTVYDVLGKQVISLTPRSTEVVVQSASLTSGVYFARIEGVNGSKILKLIKQ